MLKGALKWCRAIFIAKGFSQKQSVDYDDNFAPIARYTSIRSIISLASCFGWPLYLMDVNIDFLNGVIDEVYTNQLRSVPTFAS